MSKILTVSLFGLAGLGLALTGCGGGSDGDPGFGLTWDLHLIDDGFVNCEDAGTPIVNLDTVGANNFTSHDSFPCSTMRGTTTSVLPRGTYQVTVSLENGSGQVVSATQTTADIFGGLNRLQGLTFEVQSFSLSWTIARGNQLLTCDQANARTVQLITMAGDAKPINYMFPCPDRAGDTTAIPLGPYAVQAQILDAAGNVLATTMPMSIVVDGQRRAVLPPVAFTVN
jgi:hypothetical protein